MLKTYEIMNTHTKTNFTIFTLFLILATACSSAPDHVLASLEKAEKCMANHPDSALNILSGIPNPENLRGKAQADYSLLMTQAMHKNDCKFISDSLISIAVAYYVAHPADLATEGKALFYYGKVMQSLDSAELAMKYYLKAKDVLDETKEYKMLGLVEEGMGDLSWLQLLNKEAINNYKSSLDYYSKISDSLSISMAYRNIGRSFVMEKQVDSAFYYYDKGLSIASAKGYVSESSILRELGIIYRSANDYKRAEHYFLASIGKEKINRDLYRTYLSLGYLYVQYNEFDKAENVLKKCLEWKNDALQRDAYDCLYQLERKHNNLPQALLYKDKTDSLLDLTYNTEKQEMVARLQKKYDNEKLQKEKLQIVVRAKNLLFVVLAAFFVAGLIGFYFYLKNRANKRQIRYIQQQLQEKENAISVFEHDLENLKQEQNKSEDYKNKIGELNGKIVLLNLQKKELNVQLEKMGGTALKVDTQAAEYMAAFRTLLSLKKLDANDDKTLDISWKRLYALCDLVSFQFSSRLLKAYPDLTRHSQEICCLLRLGFTNDELSRIFNTTTDSVTKAKSRAKKGLELPANGDLEGFIRNF